MSKYTTTIRSIVETGYDLGLKDYPIFDESYREVLNKKIIDHYYFREIGLETVALFKHFLNTRMNEIMYNYNELYKMQKRIFDAGLDSNVNLTETYEKVSDGESKAIASGTSDSTSESTVSSKNKNLRQDTPQGKLKQGDLDSQEYATELTFDNNDTESEIKDSSGSSSTNDTTIKNTEEYIKKIVGNNGNKYAIELLTEIKNSIINIDIMIIEELADLFMGLY